MSENHLHDKSANHSPISEVFRILGATLLVGCLLLVAICVLAWYIGPKSPVSPPETQLGTSPSFDAILADANENWQFLFTENGQVITTDAYGRSDEVLLDTSGRADLNRLSISPDGDFLLVNYNCWNERTDDTDRIINRLRLLDMESGSVKEVTTHLEGFQVESRQYWLSPNTFLVGMDKYTRVPVTEYKEDGFRYQKTVRFLRYDLQNLDSPQLVEFDTEAPVIRMKYDPPVMLFASEYEPIDKATVYAVDSEGKRVATPEEREYFRCSWSSSCDSDAPDSTVPEVRLEPVIDAIEGFGRYYQQNWDREYVFLNDELVRVSNGAANTPVWDSELELFIWFERQVRAPYRSGVFQMDTEGHYRFWHIGTYWGKIAKEN